MKKEFDIEDEWVSYEIHPETPPEGILLIEKFKGINIEAMRAQLNMSGNPYGITFGEMKFLPNSQKALEASEFARVHGKFDEFHEKVFHAYFTESKDIGKIEVLLDIARDLHLDTESLVKALENKTFVPVLKKAQYEGRKYYVTGTPTFIINGKYIIVGAQPLENFRRALKQIASKEE